MPARPKVSADLGEGAEALPYGVTLGRGANGPFVNGPYGTLPVRRGDSRIARPAGFRPAVGAHRVRPPLYGRLPLSKRAATEGRPYGVSLGRVQTGRS